MASPPTSSRNKRIVVLIAADQRRGSELQGVALAHSLRASGFDTEVIALAPGAGSASIGVEVLGSMPLGVRTLWRLRRRTRGTLVIAHGSTTLPAMALASLGSSTQWWYRSIGDPAAWVRGRLHRWRTGWLMRRAHRVVALWEGAASDICRLYGVPEGRVSAIPNDRSAAVFRPATQADRQHARAQWGLTRPTVLLLGALSHEKAPVDAVEVVAGLDDVDLLIAGDGPLSDVVRSAAERMAPGRVRLLGAVPDVRAVLAASDVLLLTSRTEGMPGVVIEALMCGVPVVAPSVGAIASMLVDEEDARCCAPGDLSVLQAALEDVLARADGTPRRGSERAIARFETESVAAQWVELVRANVAVDRSQSGRST